MKLNFQILPELHAVAKLKAWPEWAGTLPVGFKTRALFSLTSTDEEISLVCEETVLSGREAACIEVQRGWRAMRMEGTLDFSLVGILATITGLLSAQGISIFAISTFNTDYILVKESALPNAIIALRGGGHVVR